MSNKKIYVYCWANDFRECSGEGKLARLFINKEYSKYEVIIKSLEGIYIYTNGNLKKIKSYGKDFNSFYNKYLIFFYGIFLSWKSFVKKQKFIYLNYIPFWNFLIFLTLAPKTFLGPITGSKFHEASFIRKYLFPLCYKLSDTILLFRYKKIVFSTDNLKSYLSKNNLCKIHFNFCLNFLQSKKPKLKKKKDIDILIYYRNHDNKKNIFLTKICKLLNHKKKIYAFGDKIDIPGIVNFGFKKNNKIQELILRSKLCINNRDNFYSFFMMECLNFKTNVVCDINTKPIYSVKSKNIFLIDYNNILKSYKIINNLAR